MFPKELEKLEQIGKMMETLELLKEIIPPMQIRTIKIKDKEYIAILFERKKTEA